MADNPIQTNAMTKMPRTAHKARLSKLSEFEAACSSSGGGARVGTAAGVWPEGVFSAMAAVVEVIARVERVNERVGVAMPCTGAVRLRSGVAMAAITRGVALTGMLVG